MNIQCLFIIVFYFFIVVYDIIDVYILIFIYIPITIIYTIFPFKTSNYNWNNKNKIDVLEKKRLKISKKKYISRII